MELKEAREQCLKVDSIEGIFRGILQLPSNHPVQIEKMTEGITNLLYKCSAEGCSSMLFKIWGPKTELLINRQDEVKVMNLLHQIGLFPQIYCEFANGIVYGWVEGRALKASDLADAAIYPLIARTLSCWHRQISLTLHQSTPKKAAIISMIEKVHFQCKETCPLSTAKVEQYLSFLSHLDFEIVFCHNDLLAGNIVLSAECPEGSVKFIDFEYSGWNWRSFDLANHFVEFCGLALDLSKYPKRAFRRAWIQEYLEAEAEDSKVLQIEREIEILTPAVNLFWGLWALVQAKNSVTGFDYLSFAEKRFALFTDPERENLRFNE